MADFNDTKKAITDLTEIIKKLDDEGYLDSDIIKDHFTRYILIVFYRDVEVFYEEIAEKRIHGFDSRIVKFLVNHKNLDFLIKILKSSKPNKKIQQELEDKDNKAREEEIRISNLESYSNFIVARNAVAHRLKKKKQNDGKNQKDIKISWEEITKEGNDIIQIGEEVLDEIDNYLNLETHHINYPPSPSFFSYFKK